MLLSTKYILANHIMFWLVLGFGVSQCVFWINEFTNVCSYVSRYGVANGILRSREKEGAYTLCNSMDETGEHYAK